MVEEPLGRLAVCLLSNTPWPPWQKAAVYEVQRKAAGADCQKLTRKAYSLKGFIRPPPAMMETQWTGV